MEELAFKASMVKLGRGNCITRFIGLQKSFTSYNQSTMKSNFALLMLISIALVSCSNAELRADDFAKKIDCSEKIETVKMQLTERKNENRDAVGGYTLNELFYSPSMNTCVFSYIYVEKLCGVNYGCTKPEEYDNQVIYVIEDALTGNKIYNERYYQVGDEEVAAFENKIAELKM